jgi:hypothetical protein
MGVICGVWLPQIPDPTYHGVSIRLSEKGKCVSIRLSEKGKCVSIHGLFSGPFSGLHTPRVICSLIVRGRFGVTRAGHIELHARDQTPGGRAWWRARRPGQGPHARAGGGGSGAVRSCLSLLLAGDTAKPINRPSVTAAFLPRNGCCYSIPRLQCYFLIN